MISVRRGGGLLEVVVALPLLALLGVVAVRLVLGAHQAVTLTDSALGASRELRHAGGILAAELRSVRAVDLVAWTDTSVEFDGTVGVGVVCAAAYSAATQVALLGENVAGWWNEPAASTWSQPPQPGDQVSVWLAGRTPLDSLRGGTYAVRTVTRAARCAASPLSAGNADVVLSLAGAIGGTVAVGTPARLTRRARYSLYRSSEGGWFLGRRTLGVAGWDVVQPVAGPLRPARDRGLHISVHDSSGAVLSSVGRLAAARVRVELRAAPRATRTAARALLDSVRVDVALRAERGKQQ